MPILGTPGDGSTAACAASINNDSRLDARGPPPVRLAVAVGLLALALGLPASAVGFDPVLEAKNFLKTEERNRYITLTPQFQARLNQQNLADLGEAERIILRDPERDFLANICHQRKQECAGDVRFYDWERNGFGMVEPVLYTARNGATISGTVWATAAGPAKRPGVVITTGSVQAPEPLYWGLAASLAKAGYVVLVYDVQGQGRSDTSGAAPDEQEGVPSQAGQPFYDGTEDGLDFLLSTPSAPYDPRPSCGNANGGTGTDHSAKQDRRVRAGLNAGHNPFWQLVDPARIGVAGHSLGAGALSYIGQIDPRVDAIVAWDNLREPSSHPDCPSGSSPRPDAPELVKPAIGMSNDYGLIATPRTSDPDPQSANGGFSAYRTAGVDSMQVNTRGGTHYEYSFIPGMTVHHFGLATLRGMDMVAWYTRAWLDKHVRCAGDLACEMDADARLLTDRWRDDLRSGQVDANADPNLYSFYLRSRFDFLTAAGAEVTCDDMRAGCATMAPDGGAPGFDFVADAMTLDSPGAGPGPASPPAGGAASGPQDGQASGACTLAQVGSGANDTPVTLPPTDAGDSIRGRGGADRLRGGNGDDCLSGNRGDDRLRGGPGRDRLRCGPGDDNVQAGRTDRVARSCERIG